MPYGKIKWKFLPISLLLCASMSWAQPVVIDGIAGVVGSTIILKSDVEQQHTSMVRQGLLEMNKGDLCKVFEELLFEKLMIHQAEVDSVVVSEDEIEGTIEGRLNMLSQQMGSVEKLEEYYEKSYVEIKEMLFPIVKDNLTAQRMQGKITGNVEVTPSEVRTFFNKLHPDSVPLISAQVEIAQIVKYPEVGKEAKQEAIDQLNRLKERIEKGSSFSTMAVLYSEDPGSAKNGGEYKGIKRGQFVAEFEGVAFNLRVGEISKPVLTEYGYHIIQLLQRRGEELDVRHILIKPKISDENLNATKAYLDSIRDLINEGFMTFEDAAERISEDENTRYNKGVLMNPNTGDSRWETGDLNREMFVTVDKLRVGEISKPAFFRTQDQKEGFRLVKLTSRVEPHRANLKEDYQYLKRMAIQGKNQEIIDKWIKKKLDQTFVKVNNDIFDCSFKNAWIKETVTTDAQ